MLPVCGIFSLGLLLALRSHDQIPASHWLIPPPSSPPQKNTCFFWAISIFCSKNPISPSFDASENKNIATTICIGRKILCLPYAGFFSLLLKSSMTSIWPLESTAFRRPSEARRCSTNSVVINRPGVARAVLQTAL